MLAARRNTEGERNPQASLIAKQSPFSASELCSDHFPVIEDSFSRNTGPPEGVLPSPPPSAGFHRADFSSWSMDTVSTYSDLDTEAGELQYSPGSLRGAKLLPSSSLVAIQAEHAEPTFVGHCKDSGKPDTKPSRGIGTGRLRHYRSESDLELLHRMLVATGKTPASFPRALRSRKLAGYRQSCKVKENSPPRRFPI